MNATDFLVEIVGIAVIVFMLAYARWQGQDDRRRQQRVEQRRSWTLIQRLDEYSCRFVGVDDLIDECLEEAA